MAKCIAMLPLFAVFCNMHIVHVDMVTAINPSLDYSALFNRDSYSRLHFNNIHICTVKCTLYLIFVFLFHCCESFCHYLDEQICRRSPTVHSSTLLILHVLRHTSPRLGKLYFLAHSFLRRPSFSLLCSSPSRWRVASCWAGTITAS